MTDAAFDEKLNIDFDKIKCKIYLDPKTATNYTILIEEKIVK